MLDNIRGTTVAVLLLLVGVIVDIVRRILKSFKRLLVSMARPFKALTGRDWQNIFIVILCLLVIAISVIVIGHCYQFQDPRPYICVG